MNWIYSIFVAGLLFGAEEPAAKRIEQPAPTEVTIPAARQDVTERFEQNYPLQPNGRVSLSNINGDIAIEPWDRSEVRVVATKTADSAETLAEIEISVDAEPAAVRIKTEMKGWGYGNRNERNRYRRSRIDYRISVPRTARLDSIENVNGSVSVSGLAGSTKIAAVNGNVNASGLSGVSDLSTVNGQVIADFTTVARGSRISLSTVNGSVAVTLPSDVDATIRADSLNGPISNEFGLPVRKGQYIGRDLHGRLGSGDAQIRLNSVNGELAIKRKNDGRQQTPATNLLRGTEGDEEPDVSSNVEAARVNAEVSRAMSRSNADVQRAMQEAEAAMEKARPELDRLRARVEIDTERLRALATEQTAREALIFAREFGAGFPVGAPRIAESSKSIPVDAEPQIILNTKGCSVVVRAWDKQEVRYTVSEVAGRRVGEPVTVTDSKTGNQVKVEVVNDAPAGRFFGSSFTARVEVWVPKRSSLSITADGDVRISGITGKVEIYSDGASSDVRDVSGDLKLAIGDGRARVIGFNGGLVATSENGEMYLEGTFSSINAETSGGRTVLSLPASANATVFSNIAPEVDSLRLENIGEDRFRIGNGLAEYRFRSKGGALVIRSAELLSVR